jgi:hypothetical protein
MIQTIFIHSFDSSAFVALIVLFDYYSLMLWG